MSVPSILPSWPIRSLAVVVLAAAVVTSDNPASSSKISRSGRSAILDRSAGMNEDM